MPFPTTSTATMATALEEIQRLASEVDRQATTIRNRSAAGPIDARTLLGLNDNLRVRRQRMAALTQTPGLADYARDQFSDPALDIGAEWVTMRDAIQAVEDHIVAAFPSHDGFILAESFNADGSRSPRVFSVASLSTLRSLLDAVIASIG